MILNKLLQTGGHLYVVIANVWAKNNYGFKAESLEVRGSYSRHHGERKNNPNSRSRTTQPMSICLGKKRVVMLVDVSIEWRIWNAIKPRTPTDRQPLLIHGLLVIEYRAVYNAIVGPWASNTTECRNMIAFYVNKCIGFYNPTAFKMEVIQSYSLAVYCCRRDSLYIHQEIKRSLTHWTGECICIVL